MTLTLKKRLDKCGRSVCSIYRGCHYIQLRDE